MIIGTVVNACAIVAGGAVGLVFAKTAYKAGGASVVADSVMKVLGIAVIVLGIKMALAEHDFLPVVVCLALGTFIGEVCKIEKHIERFGVYLKKTVKSESDTFVSGFLSASILFCVGATAILGSIQDGLMNDPELLLVKSILDGVTSVIFAMTMGIGVLFAAIPIIIYQGALSLSASQLSFLLSNPVYVNGISAAGGILVLGIGLNLAQITRLRTGNMLPSLLLIPLYDVVSIHFHTFFL
ncbi:MAG: DUF554 domain-containing protein [Deferribacteraceae bacterium]|jgi:uncharacterized membrane protein YqgA involved in biofilm formation|nr:DUF554 domain-containing protein [Deferribacteraceae bacterium]